MTAVLKLEGLGRDYKVHKREGGVGSALKSLFKREWETIQAVKEISFSVEPGEVVAFLGPNGAGKTTTIKMLAGLLYPTRGHAEVLGFNPWSRDPALLKQITLIMGRRNQLIWDVPAIESFEFFRTIYDIPRQQYKETLEDMIEIMELGPLLNKPVRNLSLGERMRCELCGALLHRPKILYLDEPTIGLDLLAQYRFREFISTYNERFGGTVLLTSHYMGDIEDLCERVIFIEQGRLLFDGQIDNLVERFLPYKTIQLRTSTDNGHLNLEQYGTVTSRTGDLVHLRVPKGDAIQTVARLVAEMEVRDISISDPPITEIVKYVYTNTGSFE